MKFTIYPSSPKRAAIAHRASCFVFGAGSFISLLFVSLFASYSDSYGNHHAIRNIFVTSFLLSIFGALIAGLASLFNLESFLALHSSDIFRWRRLTGKKMDSFPENSVECLAYRNDYLLPELERRAKNASFWFKERDRAQNRLDHLLNNKPQYTIETKITDKIDIEEFRKKYADEIKRKEKDVNMCMCIVNDFSANAKRAQKKFLAWWDMVKTLGEIYVIDMLPDDPETEKMYDDPNKYRLDLEK